MILKKYQNYLSKVFINNFLIISLVFIVISLIISIFEEFKFFENKEVSIYYPLILSMLNIPSILYEIIPFIFLISTMFFFIHLYDRNELEILRSNGINNFKIIQIISILSLVFGLFFIFFYYTFSSNLKNHYLIFKNKFAGDNEYLAIVNETGLWIKENVEDNINIINAKKFEENILENLTITQLNNTYKTTNTLIVSKADISNKLWILKEVEMYDQSVDKKEYKKIEYQSTFDGEIISNLFSNLNSLNIYQLHNLVENYEMIGYSTTDIKIHLNKIYSLPFNLLLMSIIASILMIKLKFIKSKFFTIILGVILSVIIYYLNYFSSLFGGNETIPINLSVWLPIIVLFLCSMIGLVKINEI